MAFKLGEAFARADAKSRVLIVIVAIVGISVAIYFGAQLMGGGPAATGRANVAGAPAGLQSVPGSELSPEYARALEQANTQSAKQAEMSGTSAVPTLINVAQPSPSSDNCTVLCAGGESADVTEDINNLARDGKITPEEAKALLDLAQSNASVSEYESSLNELVKQGKLTPEQARKLLDTYRRQHTNRGVAVSAQAMDALIKSGKLPLGTATQLLALQKQNISPQQYTEELNRLVREGKIPPEVATQLQAQYIKQRTEEATKEGVAGLKQMAKSGQITQEAADALAQLQQKKASANEYETTLNKLVADGKMTPATATKLLSQYQMQLAGGPAGGAGVGAGYGGVGIGGPAGGLGGAAEKLNEITKQVTAAEQGAASEINDLVGPSLGDEDASALLDLQKKNVPPAEFQSALSQLVQSGKLTPDEAKKMLDKYTESQKLGTDLNNDVANLVKQGVLTQEAANTLTDLQNKNVSPEEYQKTLDALVKAGKLSPEEAKRLMAKYQALQTSKTEAKKLVQPGLPQAEAKKLLDLQKSNASPAEFQSALSQLVQSGKLSPDEAKKMLDKYTESQKLGADLKNDVNSLVSQGKISQDVADSLSDMQQQNLSPEEYKKALDALVQSGKIPPEEAKKLADKYQTLQDSSSSLNTMVTGGKKLSRVEANKLLDLQKSSAGPAEYQKALDELVQTGQLSTAEAKRLGERYQKLAQLRVGKKLAELESKNVPAADYAEELKNAINSGAITPDEAALLLQKYQQAQLAQQAQQQAAAAGAAPGAAPLPPVDPNVPGASELAQLQERLQAQNADQLPPPGAVPGAAPALATIDVEAFAREQAKAKAEAQAAIAEQKQKRLQELMTAMSAQAQQLVTTWQQPVAMTHKEGTPAEKKPTGMPGSGGIPGSSGAGSGSGMAPAGPPLIKAGSILFAVLDTAVNSDYPDTPVMATIIQGKFKGAKLLGKLSVVSGKDRVSLAFNMMDDDSWPNTKSISAFAIDPETAHTVLASNVDYHYMLRYGSMIATSFITGYSSAITQAGTSTSGIFGTSTTHTALSPGNKLAVGLGQIGSTMGSAMKAYFDTPPTIKVNAGVGLGILFMADLVEAPAQGAPGTQGAAGGQTASSSGQGAVGGQSVATGAPGGQAAPAASTTGVPALNPNAGQSAVAVQQALAAGQQALAAGQQALTAGQQSAPAG